MELSIAQEKAVSHYTGPCMVLAGPGSGKTFTITKRIQRLIEEYKVRPEEILVITFTKAASYEMQNRFVKLMHGNRYPVTFGTFHGVYFGILSWAYGFHAGNILSEEEKYQIIRQIINSPDIYDDIDVFDEQEDIRDIITEIGNVKSRGLSVASYQSAKFSAVFTEIYMEYERIRKSQRKIDFDDMLLLCYQLFKNRPDILKKWQERFRYILIDEFQDVNKVQYEVIKMIALPENNVFVVGDDDQSIYMFRGADPKIMLGFQKDYPDAKLYHLDENFRSSKNIVNGASKVISHNRFRYKKNLKTKNEKGACIHVQELFNVSEESKFVIRKIQEALQRDVPTKEIAVLYRTSMDARGLMEALMEFQIPFYTKDHVQNIYQHFIAKHLMAYARLAMGERSRRTFLEVMNVPNRYISRDSLENLEITFEDLRRFYIDKAWMMDRIDQFEWDVKMIKDQTPYALIQYVRKHIDYDDYLKEYAKKRHLNEDELFEIISEIEEKSKEFQTIKDWFAYIEKYSASLQKKKTEKKKQDNSICLMTMHGAKGLEFDTVILIECNEGVVPYKKAKLDEEIEEERRMFYVAMTRAKKSLTICYVKSKYGKNMESSRFVKELLLEK